MPHLSAMPPITPRTSPARPPVPWNQRPFVTYALLIAIVGIYIVTYIIDQTGDPNALNPIYQFGILDYVRVTQHGEWYRLLSAMFIHLSPAHILFNGYALWRFGVTIERLFGHLPFTVIYFIGGLCGSIASLTLSRVDSAGASGAIFALFAAEIIYVLRYRAVLGPVGAAALRELVILAAINFGLGIVPGAEIDNWAHMGGFVGGGVLAFLLISSARPPAIRPANSNVT